jgi:hypothetical protein
MRARSSGPDHLLKVSPLHSIIMLIKFQCDFRREETFKPQHHVALNFILLIGCII